MADIIEFAVDSSLVNKTTAEKIAAFNEGVGLIAETIANLPCYLYKRDENGDREKQKDKRNHLLNCENSPNSTSFNMKRNLVEDYIVHGNGYLDIHTDLENKIIALRHIPHADVTLNDSSNRNKRNSNYSYNYWTMNNVTMSQVLNLARKTKTHELKGVGVLTEGRNILANAIGLEEYSNSTLTNGFFAKAAVEKEGVLAPHAKTSLNQTLKQFFSGKKNSGKVIILDDGMKLKSVSLSPADIELMQQKEFTIKDIARLLKLQPSMLGIATGGMTYSNEKDNQLLFLKNCIQPYLTIIQQTFNKYLLTEGEKDSGYFFEFSVQDILKMSPEDEIKMWGEAVKNQIMGRNEARRKMNWKAVPEFEQPLLNLSYGIIQKDGSLLSSKSTNKETGKGGE